MIVIGQLFPVYLEQYNSQASSNIQEEMHKVIAERQIELSEEDQAALYAVQTIETDESVTIYMQTRFFMILAVLFSITIMLIGIVCHYMIRNFTAPIDNVTETALELAKGNYRARACEMSRTQMMMPLSNSINILARNLQDITTIREKSKKNA